MTTYLFHHIIGTIHPIAQVRTGVGTLLGILVQWHLVYIGVAPLTVYTTKPFEET